MDATTPSLRDGHWYTTSRPIAGAHTTPDGRPIGIFCRAESGLEPAIVDGKTVLRRVSRPARVVFQDPDGHDLMMLVNRDQVVRVELPPEQLPDLRPLDEFDHLPESRKATSWMKPGSKLTDLA